MEFSQVVEIQLILTCWGSLFVLINANGSTDAGPFSKPDNRRETKGSQTHGDPSNSSIPNSLELRAGLRTANTPRLIRIFVVV